MKLFRLCTKKYAHDLSGKGAEKTGGRWNSRGIPLVYTSESRALCTAEIAVHTSLGCLPVNYCLVTISIPDDIKIKQLTTSQLPGDWRTFPHPPSTQRIGDSFVKDNQFLILKAPSSVVQGDFNYLINPGHKDFNQIQIEQVEDFEFDTRLFR